MKALLLSVFVFSVLVVTSQILDTESIDKVVSTIDSQLDEAANRQLSLDDRYGNKTHVQAFYVEKKLIKLEASFRSSRKLEIQSYYFSKSELLLVQLQTELHPGLANWEEAKSNDLGVEELRRVKDIEKSETNYYFREGEVILTVPDSGETLSNLAESLSNQAHDLLQRLE